MAKRLFSLLLVLAMLISAFGGLALTADAAEIAGSFVRITELSELSDGGSYVFVCAANSKAMRNDNLNNWIYPSSETWSGEYLTDPDESIVWTVNGGVISPVNDSDLALYAPAVKQISLSATNSTVWSFACSESGEWTISGPDGIGTLRFNSTGWRPYSTSAGSAELLIYKLDSQASH